MLLARIRLPWLMTHRVITALGVLLGGAALAGACEGPPTAIVCDRVVEGPPDLELDPIIAHGGGAFRGVAQSNSLEALDAHYRDDGPCFIEVDVALTRDGRPALVHDWGDTAQRLFGRSGRPTLAEFLSLHMRADLTQIDLEGLAGWMETHPNATIIVDAKGDDPGGVLVQIAATRPDLVARMVPELFTLADYDLARHLGYRHVLLSLYRLSVDEDTLLRFVETHDVLGVAIYADDIRRVLLPRRLLERGLPTWLHTVNSPSQMEAERAHCVYGFYSDTQEALPASLAGPEGDGVG